MRKEDVDKIVKDLIEEGWTGKSNKDFKEKLIGGYSHDQVERVRARYNYIKNNPRP